MNQRSIANFGCRIDVDTYPFQNASYVLSVRQYRILQSHFLHQMGHPKLACDLLHFGSLVRVVGTYTLWKILKKQHTSLGVHKIYLYFRIFMLALTSVCFCSCRAHTRSLAKWRV